MIRENREKRRKERKITNERANDREKEREEWPKNVVTYPLSPENVRFVSFPRADPSATSLTHDLLAGARAPFAAVRRPPSITNGITRTQTVRSLLPPPCSRGFVSRYENVCAIDVPSFLSQWSGKYIQTTNREKKENRTLPSRLFSQEINTFHRGNQSVCIFTIVAL